MSMNKRNKKRKIRRTLQKRGETSKVPRESWYSTFANLLSHGSKHSTLSAYDYCLSFLSGSAIQKGSKILNFTNLGGQNVALYRTVICALLFHGLVYKVYHFVVLLDGMFL